MKIVNYENLRDFAYSNDKLIKGEIKGITLNFFGLNGIARYDDSYALGLEYAERGIVLLIPYYNPWCWMNRQAVSYTDEIVSVICEKYNLDKVKVVSTGGSMGGLSALVYCAYARITPIACVTNCPVCDLVYHYTERPDLPRTIYSAFGEYECGFEEALRTCSPLHLAKDGKMPNIEYTIFHCENDRSVNIKRHSEPFVKEMKKSHNINFIRVPLHDHGDLSPTAWVEYYEKIYNYFIV